MTPSEANSVAMKIMQTWRNGPAIPIWEEILQPLHYRQAVVAYERLRLESDMTPGIARFKGVYDGLSPRDEEPGLIKCQGCPGDGWVQIMEIHHEIEYSAVKACTYCERGKRNQTTVNRIHRKDTFE